MADSFTLTASDASSGEMKSSYKVPSKISNLVRTRFNPARLSFIDNALLAIAQRTSLPAGITTNALIKFFHPKIPPLF
jgi:hypothetical protein